MRLTSRDLDTPAKRAKRFGTASRHAAWVALAGSRGGIALGYRRRTGQPGSWSARIVCQGVRRETALGEADDTGCSASALSFAVAAKAAMAWGAVQQATIRTGQGTQPISLTLREALDTYCAARIRRGGDRGDNARWRLGKHVLSNVTLAATPLERLNVRQLRAWRDGLPASLRPSTVNRLVADLRAGIATSMPARTLPADLRDALRATPDAAEARPVQVLNEADLRRLLHAATTVGAEFGRLCWVLAATGTRFGQAARLRVDDVQLRERRIMVPPSLKGRPGKSRTPVPVPVGDDVIEQLKPALHGRRGHDPLLLHRGEPWRRAVHMLSPWRRALQLAGLPNDIIPYVLRHSSIVRQLSAGVPLRFVAMMHDTGTVPIERHYARYITGEIEQRAREAIIPLGSADVLPMVRPAG